MWRNFLYLKRLAALCHSAGNIFKHDHALTVCPVERRRLGLEHGSASHVLSLRPVRDDICSSYNEIWHAVGILGGTMADTKTILEQAYSAFNKRDIDGALALMNEDVSWPKASEGGRVIGKEEIRSYWTRQWSEFDGHVEPLAMTEEDGGNIRVRVHQRVKNLQGNLLSDSEVFHIFTMSGGLIAAMHLGDEADSKGGPSAAFTHQS
jgi:hypothetical protein